MGEGGNLIKICFFAHELMSKIGEDHYAVKKNQI